MSIFHPVHQSKTANDVSHHIEALVFEGVLKPGDQLPAERELAEEMEVSRPVLREAMAMLESGGIVLRKQGGGTFIADIIGQVFSEAIVAILPQHQKVTTDYLEYRREIESIAASLAAERATVADRKMLQSVVERMKSAHQAKDFELETRIDVEFHSLIGEMAHNLVLLHTLRSCYQLLSQGVFQNRYRLYEHPGGRDAVLKQHCAIADAILTGDGKTAAMAARNHIDYIQKTSLALELAEDRERLSEQRLSQRNTVTKQDT